MTLLRVYHLLICYSYSKFIELPHYCRLNCLDVFILMLQGRDEISDQDAFMSDPDDHHYYNENNVEDQVSDEDDEMWVEGFEGPIIDDDVFVDRPADHAVQEMRNYRAIMRAERRKIMSNLRKGRAERLK